jgi:N-sulfoglucosamine sulfohydrolase
MKHVTLLACLAILGHRACPNADRPNVLLIIADDCTYRDLGAYGGQARTPHLERLGIEADAFGSSTGSLPGLNLAATRDT